MRFRQEMLLGVGGVHALEALGLEPTVFHMNEGHSAFSGLERMRRLMKRGGLSLEAAKEVVKSNSVFTTHTPVPAGNDYFPPDLMGKYFGKYAEDLGLSFNECLALGRLNPDNNQEAFCMTMLAIRLSNYRNGVSKLHREVSRGMWKGIWPAFPERDVPIVSVTNGVHIPSYISQEMADLYNRYLGPRWIEDPDNEKVWERVDLIPDTELWRTHERRRERLIAFARRRVKEQLLRRGELPSEIKRAEDVLNPEALTICFARRFATYKRGDLLFRDAKRLAGILNDPERPVQIIFAGKAHPQDMAGKAIIKNIVQHIHEETFRYKVVFLEDYDINIARYMVQGADVWLNTPRRPMEACGTSGMKAVANGALHMSVLDGWWAEGYSPGAGWAIGAGEEYEDTEYQDEIESRAMYELLEREVIPAFYARTRDGTPREWIRMMKASMRRLCPIFNTHRMLEDYVDGFYVPAAVLHQKMQHERNQTAESFAEWKQKVQRHWREVRIQEVKLEDGRAEIPVGKAMPIQARIGLGQLGARGRLGGPLLRPHGRGRRSGQCADRADDRGRRLQGGWARLPCHGPVQEERQVRLHAADHAEAPAAGALGRHGPRCMGVRDQMLAGELVELYAQETVDFRHGREGGGEAPPADPGSCKARGALRRGLPDHRLHPVQLHQLRHRQDPHPDPVQVDVPRPVI